MCRTTKSLKIHTWTIAHGNAVAHGWHMERPAFNSVLFEDPADNEALDTLYRELFLEDTLGTVIRVAIRIEEQLDAYFANRAQAPEFIEKMHLDFGQKVLLAISLGLREDVRSPLQAFGKIRNSYAHKPDYQMGAPQVRDFYKTLTSNQQMVVRGFMDRTDRSFELRMGDAEDHLDMFRWIVIVLHLHVTAWRRLKGPTVQPQL